MADDSGIILAFIIVIVLLVFGFGLRIQELEHEKEILEISCNGISIVGNVTYVEIKEVNQSQACHNLIKNSSGYYESYGCGDALVSGDEQNG